MRIASKRLGRELADLKANGPPEGCVIIQADDLSTWFFSIEVLGESVFKGEKFCLRLKFSDGYPIESPEVVFLVQDGWKAPEVSSGFSQRRSSATA